MRFTISFICILFCAGAAVAQTAFTPVASTGLLDAALVKASSDVNTIESDFVQTKYMEMLSENIVSKGKFYYKKANKIVLDYTSPAHYLIVINGQQIKIVSDGKKNIYELRANKMMSQTSVLLSACMTGNLSLLSADYRLEYTENDRQYRIKILPLDRMKSYLKEIDIFLNKQDLSVEQLRMTEPALDYTEYIFTNKKKNTSLTDELFRID
ncbi:MAG: outer membrane lipoprotein carrier protein LolA [Prevotellaceae bacterium]|jgi:outer membrane lipoprotein-sorting protein|nr:outer membrane lipoprotein carrier protein LolA [Prevotellaceae bacterium]